MQKKNIFKGKSRKQVIQQARKLYKTFDNVDLRKPISDYQYYKARKIIKTYNKFAGLSSTKVVKVNKNNKKYFKNLYDDKFTRNYKQFPVHLSNKHNKVIFKNNKLIEKNDYFYIIKHFFTSDEILDPENNIPPLWAEWKRKQKQLKAFKMQVRLMVGFNMTGEFVEDEDALIELLREYQMKYDVQSFLEGVNITYIK